MGTIANLTEKEQHLLSLKNLVIKTKKNLDNAIDFRDNPTEEVLTIYKPDMLVQRVESREALYNQVYSMYETKMKEVFGQDWKVVADKELVV